MTHTTLRYLIIAFVLLITIIIGVGIYLWLPMEEAPLFEELDVPDTVNITTSETEGWQTYQNKKLGYQMQYPKSFEEMRIVKERTCDEPDGYFTVGEEAVDIGNSKINFGHIGTPVKKIFYTSDLYPGEELPLNSVEDWINYYQRLEFSFGGHGGLDACYKKVIGGYEGAVCEGSSFGATPVFYKHRSYFIMTPQGGYEMRARILSSYEPNFGRGESEIIATPEVQVTAFFEMAEQIFSTFKFATATAEDDIRKNFSLTSWEVQKILDEQMIGEHLILVNRITGERELLVECLRNNLRPRLFNEFSIKDSIIQDHGTIYLIDPQIGFEQQVSSGANKDTEIYLALIYGGSDHSYVFGLDVNSLELQNIGYIKEPIEKISLSPDGDKAIILIPWKNQHIFDNVLDLVCFQKDTRRRLAALAPEEVLDEIDPRYKQFPHTAIQWIDNDTIEFNVYTFNIESYNNKVKNIFLRKQRLAADCRG